MSGSEWSRARERWDTSYSPGQPTFSPRLTHGMLSFKAFPFPVFPAWFLPSAGRSLPWSVPFGPGHQLLFEHHHTGAVGKPMRSCLTGGDRRGRAPHLTKDARGHHLQRRATRHSAAKNNSVGKSVSEFGLNGGDDAAQVHVQTELEDVPHGGGRCWRWRLRLMARGAGATARLLWERFAVGVFMS